MRLHRIPSDHLDGAAPSPPPSNEASAGHNSERDALENRVARCQTGAICCSDIHSHPSHHPAEPSTPVCRNVLTTASQSGRVARLPGRVAGSGDYPTVLSGRGNGQVAVTLTGRDDHKTENGSVMLVSVLDKVLGHKFDQAFQATVPFPVRLAFVHGQAAIGTG